MRPEEIEPLAELARLSWERAPGVCAPDSWCRPYHRVWSTARLLLQGGRAPAGWERLHRALAALPEGGRVLISGAADAGLLANVLSGLETAGAEATVVLCDQCETPLAQGRALAAGRGRAVQTVRADVRDLDAAPFDLIYAHSFLGFFDAPARHEIARKWRELLRPGGVLVMSNALSLVPEPGQPDADPLLIEAKVDHLAEAARRAGLGEVDALCAAARDFWTLMAGVISVLDEAGMRHLLDVAGLEVEELSYADPSAGASWKIATGPRARADIVARRR